MRQAARSTRYRPSPVNLFSSRHPVVVRACRLALLLALTLGCDLGWAARTFPQNSRQVKITAVADDAIVADGDTLHLAPGLLVFNTINVTVVRSALLPGTIARVQLDQNGDVRRIWILTDDEILVRPWWQFWNRSQPQADPLQPVLTN
jgi:hypothetical protein